MMGQFYAEYISTTGKRHRRRVAEGHTVRVMSHGAGVAVRPRVMGDGSVHLLVELSTGHDDQASRHTIWIGTVSDTKDGAVWKTSGSNEVLLASPYHVAGAE